MVIDMFTKLLRGLAILAFFTVRVSGQHVSWNQELVDFGRIAANQFPPKTVSFTNNGAKRLAILLVEKSNDILIKYPQKFFNPGETGFLEITISPSGTGHFEETINVHTNLEESPATIRITAEIISITECFPDPENMLIRRLEVIDAITKVPVPEARLELVYNYRAGNPLHAKTGNGGYVNLELPIGMYQVSAQAEKYIPLEKEFYLPRSQPVIILEMNPEAMPALAETVPPDDEETPESVPLQEPGIISVDLPENQYAANNLILLLDISTSMKSGGKFALLQQSVNHLALILRHIDQVSIITYASDAQVLLTATRGDRKDSIITTVAGLQPYGITRGVKGLQTAYELARQYYIPGGNNQIILATDGEFSEKGISDDFYIQMISQYTSEDIRLSIFGFGVNQEAIDRMQKMTAAGGGSFILIDADSIDKELLIEEVKEKSFIGNE